MSRARLPLFALAIALSLVLGPLPSHAADPALTSAVSAADLPEGKRTTVGLYITAAEAAAALEGGADVLLLDVRTPEETVLVGYPAVADANIPFTYFDPAHPLTASGSYAMAPNPEFVPLVQALLDNSSAGAVLVFCRSGGRSARAVNALAEAGIDLPLYSIVDGFEGDKDANGQRSVNGWKNAGAAWSTKVFDGYLHRAR